MMTRSTIVSVAGALILGAVAGCGKPSGLIVAAVTGTVTFDGVPVESGLVTFIPDAERGTNGPIGIGIIQPDGTYRVVTDPNGEALPGAVVGFHRIRITQPDAEYRRKIKKATDVLPANLSSEQTSGLTAEVLAGVPNTIDLELESPENQ